VAPRGRLLLSAWAPPAAWCALVFLGSSFPVASGEPPFAGADKAVHAAEYAVLGALAARALALVRPSRSGPRSILLAAALAAAWGAADEVHQAFVPERTPEWGDLAADGAGALAGAALLVLLRPARVSGAPAGGGPAPPPPAPPGR
jgi:VanZ family protein